MTRFVQSTLERRKLKSFGHNASGATTDRTVKSVRSSLDRNPKLDCSFAGSEQSSQRQESEVAADVETNKGKTKHGMEQELFNAMGLCTTGESEGKPIRSSSH